MSSILSNSTVLHAVSLYFRHHLSGTPPPADNAIQPTRLLNVFQSNYGSVTDREYADDYGTDER